jgi:hypothetical protein
MSRETLIALHSAFREASKWPPPVRETVIRWLASTARKRRPSQAAPVATASQPAETWPAAWRPRSKRRRPPKPKPLRPHKPDQARILELKLLEAMQGHPGASVAGLAAIAGVGKSRALWRLHALADRREIEKDPDGHWRLKAEKPRPAAPGEEPRPTPPPSS